MVEDKDLIYYTIQGCGVIAATVLSIMIWRATKKSAEATKEAAEAAKAATKIAEKMYYNNLLKYK